MSTFMYDFGREAFAKGDIAWDSDDIRAIFVDTDDYTPDQGVDEYLSDIAGGARVATSGSTLANKSATDGVCDADDHTISAVSGDEFEGIVLYKHTGTEGTSILIAFIDNYSGLPCTPNGGNITVAWPNDANKIFKL